MCLARPGGLQLAWWPLVSTVALARAGPRDSQAADGERGRPAPGGVLKPWGSSFESGSCPYPWQGPAPGSPTGGSPHGAGVPDALSLRRRSWGTALRTCISSATAWALTRPRRRAGGWGATWAESQVGVAGRRAGVPGPRVCTAEASASTVPMAKGAPAGPPGYRFFVMTSLKFKNNFP